MSELKACSFESPLLVTDDELLVLPAEAWQGGEKWLEALKERTGIVGIVLPLEIKASAHQSRQDLLGVELLNWLRWSAEEPFRFLPVLAVAWQPLDAILRRTSNLLLVTRGTAFVRLPEAVETLPRFIKGVREKSSAWPQARPEDQERIAGGSQAEQISYHDLANEFYAAHRLWEGYKHAVSKAKIQVEVQRTEGLSLSFTKALQHKLARPAIKAYLTSRRRQASPIYYPVVSEPEELIHYHAESGLPEDIRVLMVDDEFEKGLAEVLLKMLFKASDFSFQLDGEWVYTEDNRARLVCVHSTRQAACWLTHWGFDMPELDDTVSSQWMDCWVHKLGCDETKMMGDERKKRDKWVLGGKDPLARVVDKSIRNINPTTVLLLDLRLDKSEATTLYDPREMASVRLWRTVKDKLPILIFTASRQAMIYSAIMEEAGQSDGWLTKESPDVTVDDESSSRAAIYLLERLHIFSIRRDWYRRDFNWGWARTVQYATAYRSPLWKDCLLRIDTQASRIFDALRNNSEFRTQYACNIAILGCVENEVRNVDFDIERILIARRVTVAALLVTADWKESNPEWNPEAFDHFMPGWESRQRKRTNREGEAYYVGKVINTDHLWLRSYKEREIFGILLKEECAWLKRIFPTTENIKIHELVNKTSAG